MSYLMWSLTLAGSVAFAQTEDVPLGNFHFVSDGISRGGQPSKKGIDYLAKQGYKLVIDLEGGHEPDAERALVESKGMRFETQPLDPRRAPPTAAAREASFQRILELLRDPKNHPVYLHCRHGWDRTGLAIGLHRVKNEGWTNEAAWKEMKKYGFHDIKLFRWMKDYFWSQSNELPSMDTVAPQVVEPIEENHTSLGSDGV